MKKIVLSGMGALSPFGPGKAAFVQAMSEGHTCVSEVSKFPSLPNVRGGIVKGLDCDEIIDERKFRRAADVSKYALAAAKLSIEDAGIESVQGEDTAMVVAVTHGALNYTEEYHQSLLTGGVEDISPILFSESVLNAPAGNVSIFLGSQGAVHTVVGGSTVAIKSVIMACELLEYEAKQNVIVLATEELNELSFYCRQKQGEKELAEGAASIVLENEGESTDAYCQITGFKSYLAPENKEESFIKSVEGALEMAGITMDELQLALVDAPENVRTEYLGDIATCSVKKFTGNAFCVSSMWNIIMAAESLKQGVIPEALLNEIKGQKLLDKVEHVLVCAIEASGYAASIVLSKYRE